VPRELTTWGCDFRCGYVNTKRPKIEKHEKTCFANPARRACKTCKHDLKSRDAEDCFCDHPDGEDLRPNDSGDRLSCRADCPAWEPKH